MKLNRRPHEVFLALLWLAALPQSAAAEMIEWVDFSTYQTGAISDTGLSSADGLELDATFSTLANMDPNFPAGGQFAVDDPSWPFDNNDISILTVFSGTQQLQTELTLAFTNQDGLPAGGSIGIIDLEGLGSSVVLTGYDAVGSVVPVNWSVSFYQAAGVNVTPPTWNPSTNTLSGTATLNTSFPTLNNFAFLVSDVQLASVGLTVSAEFWDGISFAASSTTVPDVPEPSSLAVFAGMGAIGLLFRCGRGW